MFLSQFPSQFPDLRWLRAGIKIAPRPETDQKMYHHGEKEGNLQISYR